MKKLTIIRFRLGSVSFLELFHRSERTKLTNKFSWLKFIVGFWYFSHIRQLSCSQNYTFAHLQVKSGTTHQDQAVQTKILLNGLHIAVPTGCCANRLLCIPLTINSLSALPQNTSEEIPMLDAFELFTIEACCYGFTNMGLTNIVTFPPALEWPYV